MTRNELPERPAFAASPFRRSKRNQLVGSPRRSARASDTPAIVRPAIEEFDRGSGLLQLLRCLPQAQTLEQPQPIVNERGDAIDGVRNGVGHARECPRNPDLPELFGIGDHTIALPQLGATEHS